MAKLSSTYSNNDTRVYKSEKVTLPPVKVGGEALKSINQPNMILDAQYNYRLIQLSAIVKITNILQPIINKNINEYVSLRARYGKKAQPTPDYLLTDKTTLRIQMPDVVWKLDEKMLEVKLPLDSFAPTPRHYDRVREAILNLTKIAVKYPQYSELTKTMLTDGQRSLCTGVYFSKDTQQKNRSYMHVFFQEDIARMLVNPCYGYSRLQPITIDNCHSVYTARIYMQICRHADGKKWAISYQDLRRMLNVDSPMKKGDTAIKQNLRTSPAAYHEFRRRVLDVARDELLEMVQKDTANYYFTYTEEFLSSRHNTPSHIIFNIYETNPSPFDTTAYDKNIKQMRYYAQEILKIGQDRINRVFKYITYRNYTYVFQRQFSAWEYICDHEAIIQHPDAYYLKSIENAIKEEQTSHDQGVLQMEIKF